MEVFVRNHKSNSYRPMSGEVVAFICPVHKTFVRGSVCPTCVGEESKKTEGPAVHIFKPMWYHDICETPLYIESKRQLKAECNKHGVVAVRLL